MRLVQPYPENNSQLKVMEGKRVPCESPVRFVKYRYKHHAAPSGYDRICDYVDAPTVPLTKPIYWLGETLLRPVGIWQARRCGKFEYSRYDFTMEMAVLIDLYAHQRCLYHFIYAEKSFHLMERFSSRRGHRFIGTVHHPAGQQSILFQDHNHFRAFDHLITMDRMSVPYWEDITGRSNVTWIPHGVDIDFFHPIEMASSDRRPRIVFAGGHERDMSGLVKIIDAVMAKVPEVRFDLIGNHETLKHCARGYSEVVLHERLSDDAYRELLQQSDILLLPLIQSTACNVVLESLACGTPIITTQGGIESYLNPSCAVVFKVGDIEGMTEAVLDQVCRLDKNKLSRSGARRTAEQFAWTEIAKRHIEIYRSI